MTFNEWAYQKVQVEGHSIVAIKGPAPAGMTYDDGSPVPGPVNVAWRVVETGELFHLEGRGSGSKDT